MSEKLPQQPENEEVDLGQLFNAIGNLFERLFSFIGGIFKGVFSALIYIIKPLVDNIKIVAIAVVITSILGFVVQKNKKPTYYSNMVVRTNFGSKYQLASNINYFNTLIGSNNLKELSYIFEIDTLTADELVSFSLEAGPETQNDLFVEYDEYVQSIDTSLVDELSYKEYVGNRNLLSGNLFSIKARSRKNDIFPLLYPGFKKTLENDFSKHKKHVRDTMVSIERTSYEIELTRLDSIQKTYLQVLKNNSETRDLSFGYTSNIPLKEEMSVTKEYDLFIKEQEILRSLKLINQSVAEENTYFDVLSTFDRLGNEDKSIGHRYFILFPILTLLLFIITFLVLKAFNFIKNYE
ncbi:hypothetical protein HSX10_07800 [Winogradskyella undariae]|uniref:hypothetical protein n=1 Tax=Winogradskyella undariae TaxID=1285465 RepID=UPI00156B9CE9|nr:hypothetical protein [Winogradskyella undariae]NRR91464.1 hypothetical protein [Winogradskyella undariae]